MVPPADVPSGDAARRRTYAAIAIGSAMLASLAAGVVALWPTEPASTGTTVPSASAVPEELGRATPPVVRTPGKERQGTVTGTNAPETPDPGSDPAPSSSAAPENPPSSPPKPPPSSTPEASSSPSPEPSPSSPPEEKPSFAGEWAGVVRRLGRGRPFPIRVSLPEAVVQGAYGGTMSWGAGRRHCFARLTRVSLTDQEISLSLTRPRGRGCRGGTLVLSEPHDDQANVRIVDHDGRTRVSGSVRR